MSGISPEDADDLLAKSIRQHAAAYGEGGDELLSSFVVVCCWIDSDTGKYKYSVHSDRPTAAPHEVKGLLNEGIEWWDDRYSDPD